AFLLPNPYRLIIDIHGRQPQRTTNVAKPTTPKIEPKAEAKVEPPKTIESVKPAEKKADTTVAKNNPPVKKIPETDSPNDKVASKSADKPVDTGEDKTEQTT